MNLWVVVYAVLVLTNASLADDARVGRRWWAMCWWLLAGGCAFMIMVLAWGGL